MAKLKPTPPEHPRLGGEAPHGLYGFEDETGNPIIGGEGIIPLLEQINGQPYQFIGTGFFITSFGVFATAKHILENRQTDRLVTWQVIPQNKWIIRPIDQIGFHDIADLAIGMARQAVLSETDELVINRRLPLTMKAHSVGSLVSTYAYPNTIIRSTEDGQILSFQPRFYEGHILEHLPNGRDTVLIRGPCYRTSMIIHHGASGGPVAGPSGRVFALNSTGFDGTGDSYISQIDAILDLSINMRGENGVEQITIKQLADQGDVTIDP